jgi:hypothetical protein
MKRSSRGLSDLVKCERFGTDLASDAYQDTGMTKKKKTLIESARTTIASVKKEMEMSRLTESVRNDSGYQAELGAETPVRSGKSSSPQSKI